MNSTGITPKAGRIIVVAFGLLGLIWSLRYFNLFATTTQYTKLLRPSHGGVPEYPKIEELTAKTDKDDHTRTSKFWFFGAAGDKAVGVEDSQEWFRLALSASAETAGIPTKDMGGVVAASVTAIRGAESYGSIGAGSIGEDISPARMTAQQTSAPSTLPSLATKAKVHSYNGSISEGTAAMTSGSMAPISTPLVLYAYSPSPWALPNLNYFLTHGIHGSATFIFIINGALVAEENAERPSTVRNSTDGSIVEVLGLLEPYVEKHPNVEIWKRTDTCYDLGAYAEVLKTNFSELVTLHKRFILMNASLRGPFVPFWSRECWSDAYLRPLDAKASQKGSDTMQVKLVGMTINCVDVRPKHIQSMILATDQVGMRVLLGEGNQGLLEASNVTGTTSNKSFTNVGIDSCPISMDEAVNIEVSLTALIQSYNYTVRAMMAEYWSKQDYELDCTNGDVNAAKGAYEGGDLGVFETLFIKTRWAVEAEQTERLTEWYNGAVDSGMSNGAWDKCG